MMIILMRIKMMKIRKRIMMVINTITMMMMMDMRIRRIAIRSY